MFIVTKTKTLRMILNSEPSWEHWEEMDQINFRHSEAYDSYT